MKAVDKGHYEAVRKIFEQKKSTPYFGILMEIGCWPYSFVLIYKRLMYFHHIIHSDERRIIRKVVVNQMNGEGKGKPWFNHGVEEWLVKFGMPVEDDGFAVEFDDGFPDIFNDGFNVLTFSL